MKIAKVIYVYLNIDYLLDDQKINIDYLLTIFENRHITFLDYFFDDFIRETIAKVKDLGSKKQLNVNISKDHVQKLVCEGMWAPFLDAPKMQKVNVFPMNWLILVLQKGPPWEEAQNHTFALGPW